MNARVVALPLLAAAAAAGFWWFSSRPSPGRVPAATWRLGAGTDYRQARNYDEADAETPLRLSYHCTEERHVYVFSRSAEDGTLLLFPSPDVRGAPANPLPAGHTVLPGELDGEPLSWTTRHQILAATTYVVVAAEQPVPELERLLPGLRRWTNTALTDGTMAVTNPPQGVEVVAPARSDWPAALLARAARRGATETLVNGPLHADEQLPGVWTASVAIKERPGSFDGKPDGTEGLQPQVDAPKPGGGK